ncbi:MAG: hypothetical protein ACOYY2_02315 [Actinomycetota bacterium]
MPPLRLLPELEASLRLIPGVRAASVVTGPDAVPTEVHVLTGPGKPPKQVVRDVQSLALARYEIDIDHRIVSVVQLDDDEAPTPAPGRSTPTARPAISSIAVRTAGPEVEVTVTVTAGRHDFEGRARGPSGASHRPRIVGSAALNAVGELLGLTAELESTQVHPVGTREVALTVVTLVDGRGGEQVVTGSALVRGDEAEATARSVLAALNRRLAG